MHATTASTNDDARVRVRPRIRKAVLIGALAQNEPFQTDPTPRVADSPAPPQVQKAPTGPAPEADDEDGVSALSARLRVGAGSNRPEGGAAEGDDDCS